MKPKNPHKSIWIIQKREIRSLISLFILVGLIILVPIIIEKIWFYSPLADDSQWLKEVKMDSLPNKDFNNSSNGNLTESSLGRNLGFIAKEPSLFDPNKATYSSWKKFNLPDYKIRTIQKYLAKGGHFFKPRDIEKIYGLNEFEKRAIEPYINIPKPIKTQNHSFNFDQNRFKKKKINPIAYSGNKIPLNSASFQDFWRSGLLNRNEIWDILNFRNRNGSFTDIRELKNLRILNLSTYNRIEKDLSLN